MEGNRQKRREKTTGTWVQGQQSLEEGRKDSGYFGENEWVLGRQLAREKGRMGVGMTIVKIGRNGVRDDNHQERAHSARDKKINDSFEYNRYDRI